MTEAGRQFAIINIGGEVYKAGKIVVTIARITAVCT